MQRIRSTTELKNAIQLLEFKQAIVGQSVGEEFRSVCDSLKPANLLKNTLKDVGTSPSLIHSVLETAVGLSSGYIAKKLVVGSSNNIMRNILGMYLQHGVTNVASNHTDDLIILSKSIVHFIFRKKTNETDHV